MIDNNLNINTKNQVNNINTRVKPEQAQNINIVDPTKVNKPVDKGQQDLISREGFKYNSESVYNNLIHSLRNSPVLSDSAKKILLNTQMMETIKNDPIVGKVFTEFLEDIKMGDKEIFEFLKFQNNKYTKFNGKFFNELRGLIIKDREFTGNIENTELKILVRNFLKSYDAFASVEETNDSVDKALKHILYNIPQVLKEPLEKSISKLGYTNSEKDLEILKNEILPFIGRYISKMKDFGPVKEYTSMLIHNMVRLESGSRAEFTNSLDNLMSYIKYNFGYDDVKLNELKDMLLQDFDNLKSEKNESSETFIKLLESGIKESKNIATKNTMEEVAEALLISQNVQIPLTHIFLPLNYNGTFMISELWIEKEYSEDTDKEGNGRGYKPSYKMFITFDIDNMGHFETIIKMKEDKIAFNIYIPSILVNNRDKIKQDLNNILNKNELNLVELEVYESVHKRKFSEVFNVIDGSRGINVRI